MKWGGEKRYNLDTFPFPIALGKGAWGMGKKGEHTNMKLWQKGFKLDKKIEEFTIGKDKQLDLVLAEFDVQGSIAHAKMLESVGLLTREESESLLSELKTIYNDIKKGQFIIEEGVEDIHSQIELLLTQRLGEIGKKIHTGRSRNDQILLDLRLFIRHEIQNIVYNTQQLFEQLIFLSDTYKDVLMPGYTHLQIAMPSSFGLWFAGYGEGLIDDLIQIHAAFKIVNKNPLGSAAGYGSSLPLDRGKTTGLLGFESMNYNVICAQLGRGKTEKAVSNAIASLAHTLAKLAMDICLYMGENYSFITFPETLTTGSSIMPHKKNPDVFELIRAKCNKLIALPNEIQLIITNLPSGYHRDFQILKENFIPAFEEIKDCLTMTTYMLNHIIVNKEILSDAKYHHLFSVEAVNSRVKKGVPFRDAYQQVALEIKEGRFEHSQEVKSTHEGSIGNLCNEQIIAEMKAVIGQFDFTRIQKAMSNLLK
jgi:argininosuccinate lyase